MQILSMVYMYVYISFGNVDRWEYREYSHGWYYMSKSTFLRSVFRKKFVCSHSADPAHGLRHYYGKPMEFLGEVVIIIIFFGMSSKCSGDAVCRDYHWVLFSRSMIIYNLIFPHDVSLSS